MPGPHPAMDRNLSLEKIDIHDHVACFFRNEGERARGMARLARIGMERNERCYCLLGECHEGDVRQALRELGMKENEVRYSPALCLPQGGGTVPGRRRILRGPMPGPAHRDGRVHPCRKGTVGPGSSSRPIPSSSASAMNVSVASNPVWNESVDTEQVACICLYDGENSSHSEVLAAVSTHPSLVIRGFVCRNYFYNPPEEFAQTGGCLPEAKQLLEKMLDIQICQISLADEDSGETNAVLEEEVARRERAERALKETFAHQSEVLDGLEDGICLMDLDHKVLLTNHVFERFREACGCRGTATRAESGPDMAITGGGCHLLLRSGGLDRGNAEDASGAPIGRDGGVVRPTDRSHRSLREAGPDTFGAARLH